jgi:hypothetical protein
LKLSLTHSYLIPVIPDDPLLYEMIENKDGGNSDGDGMDEESDKDDAELKKVIPEVMSMPGKVRMERIEVLLGQK